MPNPTDLIEFTSRQAMAMKIADVVEAVLGKALAANGKASLAVSGGSTPELLYDELSQRDLDWGNVTAILVDERWVPPGQEGSNETFIRRTLQQNKAASIKVVGLWRDAPSPSVAAKELKDVLAVYPAFDAVIMGMGEDGHTASWFPYAEGLDAALHGDRAICAVHATQSKVTGKHLDRLTLTAKRLGSAHFSCLLLSGESKKRAFDKAASDGSLEEMPVRKLLQQTPSLWSCYAP